MNSIKKAEFIFDKSTNLDQVKHLVISCTNNKGVKQSCMERFITKTHKQEIQHRSKSKAEQFEELLGGKLAEMYHINYRDKNNLTPSLISDTSVMGEYKGMHTSLYETVDKGRTQKRKKRVRPNSLMRASNKVRKSKQVKNYEKEYHTQNKLNLENNTHAILLDSKLLRDNKMLKNDDKKLIVTANNSYIHNLNIAPEGFTCTEPSKSMINNLFDKKSIKNPIQGIELELNKKIFEAEKFEGGERQEAIMKAHKEVLISLGSICPYFEPLLLKVNKAYDDYLKYSKDKYEQRLMKEKKIPRLDLSKVRKNCEKEESVVEKSKKVKVPTLKLDNLNKKEYHEEFMAKADEFSLSWKEQLNKEKRC